jgi:hypothetical protein
MTTIFRNFLILGVLATALFGQSTGSTGGGGGGAAAPPEADVTVTASAASIVATNLVTGGSVGLRRVEYHMWLNTACTTGFTTDHLRFVWSDGSTKAFVAPAVQASSGINGAIRRYVSGTLLLHLAAGQNLSYETNFQGTCLTGSSSYNFRMVVTKF